MSATQSGKIPVIIVGLTGEKGGVDRVIEQYILHADPSEFLITAIVRDVPGILEDPALAGRASVVRLPYSGRPSMRSELHAGRTIFRETLRAKSAVLNFHDHYGLLAGLPAWRLRSRSLPMVATLHMHTSWIPGSYRAKRFMAVSESYMLRRAKVIVPVSNDYARRLGALGFPADQIQVIHNGIDLDAFGQRSFSRDSARASLGVKPGQFVFGFAGRFSLQKRPIELIQAVGLLKPEEIKDVIFLLAGKGVLQEEVEAEIRSQNLMEKVCLVGQISDIQRFYAAIDVLLLPSSLEGLSMTLLEAMATEVPALATRVGGNSETVEDPESGWLMEDWKPETIAAGIRRVLQNRAEVPFRGAAARRRIKEEFSVSKMVSETSEIYRRTWLARIRR